MKFRIKKIVRRNGNIQYYPQYKVIFKWKNVLDHPWFPETIFCPETRGGNIYYATESQCKKCIEGFKNYLNHIHYNDITKEEVINL